MNKGTLSLWKYSYIIHLKELEEIESASNAVTVTQAGCSSSPSALLAVCK